jgi:hypothetical protein
MRRAKRSPLSSRYSTSVTFRLGLTAPEITVKAGRTAQIVSPRCLLSRREERAALFPGDG